MILAHKLALDPNNGQETYFRKAAGVAPLCLQLGVSRMATTGRCVEDRSHGGQNRLIRHYVSNSTPSNGSRSPGCWRRPKTPPDGD